MCCLSRQVCDWCKHARHTKEYLDFGSGDERLQFCCSKCLNQYKMDLFYREARAALAGSGSAHKDEEPRPKTAVAENQKLLTPEAWDKPTETSSPVSARIQTSAPPSSTRLPQRPLPFVVQSPTPHPPGSIQSASFAPPPLLQPGHAPYMPLPHTPQLAPPWPQPMLLSPYPVFVPIPVPVLIPIPPQMVHRGVIRSRQEDERMPGHSEETNENVTSERCASPLSSVIQCLRKHKEETSNLIVTPRIVSPASLYSLARSTAMQAASLSLDSADSALNPSPLSDCEGGRDDGGSTNRWAAEQTDCQSDQSKESRGEEEALMAAQTQSWEENTDLGSEPSGRDDPEPPAKRLCLRPEQVRPVCVRVSGWLCVWVGGGFPQNGTGWKLNLCRSSKVTQ